MCNEKFTKEKQETVFHKYTRKDYGEVVSIDINFRLIKEFLQAKMYVEMGIPTSGDHEMDEHNLKVWNENVKPFFDHMSEIMDTL